MTTNHAKAPMDPMRKAALVAGVLYLVTFVGSIPALPLYHNILHNPRYLLGGASDTGVLWGAVARSSAPWPASALPSPSTPSPSATARPGPWAS